MSGSDVGYTYDAQFEEYIKQILSDMEFEKVVVSVNNPYGNIDYVRFCEAPNYLYNAIVYIHDVERYPIPEYLQIAPHWRWDQYHDLSFRD